MGILILTFHAIDGLSAPLSFSPALFSHGLQRLQQRGYRSLTVSEAAGALQTGLPREERLLAITFDDGYASVWTEAFPVLQRLGFRATVFLNTGGAGDGGLPPMEGRARLRWPQVRALHEAGFEIGAHSVTHPDLTRLAAPDLDREMAGSRDMIEAHSGIRPVCFAYPYGYHSAPVRDAARRHFHCACSAALAVARPGHCLFALPRLEMHYFRTPALFNLLGSPCLGAYLRLRRGPRRLRQALLRAAEALS